MCANRAGANLESCYNPQRGFGSLIALDLIRKRARRRIAGSVLLSLFLVGLAGCSGGDKKVVWRDAFDTSSAGTLSSVWGSGPSDVFMVGGTENQAEIYHFDGEAWSPMPDIPDVSLLVWVFGFGPNDVFAVGLDGAMVHYDGSDWTSIDPGTTADLWGIWGATNTDLWIVGGSVSAGDPVILHYDGSDFETHELAESENPLGVHSLFKVFGIGDALLAVGQRGLVIEYDGSSWKRLPAGEDADDDFISLWGTSDDNIVMVGGRSSARIAHYDGSTVTTVKPEGVGGLNAVFMEEADSAHVGGVPGYVAEVDVPGLEVRDQVPTADVIHALWGDGAGRVFAVGGLFSPPYRGIALVRTEE